MSRLDDARALGRQLRATHRLIAADMAAEVRAETLDTDELAAVADLFADWEPDVAVTVGDALRWDGGLVECLQAHTTQADWTPDQTPALWKVHRVAGAVTDWVQPTGAGGYELGERVRFEGQVYESIFNGLNVWSPAAYPQGWQLVG